jgi:WD40 repeat protein
MKTSAVYAAATPDLPSPAAGRMPMSRRESVDTTSGVGVPIRLPQPQQQASRIGVNRSRAEIVEGNLQMFDVIEGACEVMCVRYSPDGTLIAAGFSDGSIKVHSADTGQCLFVLSTDGHATTKLPVTNIRFYPSDADDDTIEHRHVLAASYASGEVRFWHYTSGSCLHTTVEPRSQTMSLAFNPTADKFVTVGADPQVYLYDVETKQRISIMDATDSRDKMDGHRARVFSVIYHPFEPNVLLTGGWDDTVQFWDDRQRHAVRKFYGPHICGDALDIDPVHNHILTGSWRKECPLQIWDYRTAEKIKDVPQDIQHPSQLYCAQWLARDSIVSGGCFSNMARVVDRGTLNTTGQLVQLPQGVYCLDNDRQGPKPRLAVGAACKIYILKFAK